MICIFQGVVDTFTRYSTRVTGRGIFLYKRKVRFSNRFSEEWNCQMLVWRSRTMNAKYDEAELKRAEFLSACNVECAQRVALVECRVTLVGRQISLSVKCTLISDSCTVFRDKLEFGLNIT
jgi:hypothetical protein